MSTGGLRTELVECYTAGLHGDLRRFKETHARLQDRSDPESDAWRLLLSSLASLSANGRVDLDFPALTRIVESGDQDTRALAGLAVVNASSASFARLDAGTQQGLCEWHEALEPEDKGWGPLLRARLALLLGQENEARRLAEGAEVGSAESLGSSSLVIERQAWIALCHLTGTESDSETFLTGLKLARRASRMARTESLNHQEYLANWVLSRARRLTGRPHLANRILASLLQFASPHWLGFLGWEQRLSGGVHLPPPSTLGPRWRQIHQALTSVGNAPDLDHGLSALRDLETHTVASPLRRDFTSLRSIMDPTSTPVGRAVHAWCDGELDPVPDGLVGVNPVGTEEAAYVSAAPGRAARRVLALGLPLLGNQASPLPSSKGRQSRTESGIAALLLAGPRGIETEDLFLRLYGFSFDADLHRGVFDVLVHRMRARLGALAAIERVGTRLIPKLADELVVPDPRTSPAADFDLLRVLANAGSASAKDAAAALDLPVRTVQEAFKRLVEDGACRLERRGRGHIFVLEDTTFAEPTRF